MPSLYLGIIIIIPHGKKCTFIMNLDQIYICTNSLSLIMWESMK